MRNRSAQIDNYIQQLNQTRISIVFVIKIAKYSIVIILRLVSNTSVNISPDKFVTSIHEYSSLTVMHVK
jgi:hypothetical protein